MEDNSEKTLETKSIDTKYPLLEFEKQIFIDVFEKDALLIIAKGLSYNAVIANLLWVYKDPGNLVLVINSADHEEKYFTDLLKLSPLPNLGGEREKAYLEGGIFFVSSRVLVVDLLKQRVPTARVSGVLVLRAHTVLESCQEAFALRLYRQGNKTGFVKAFSNSPISFTFGFHQVEKVMRALFVTELFLWPRFHGAVIKCLKQRAARVEELRVPLSASMAHIQACLLDIINYVIKQLKASNKMLDLQEITTENCITKKFHKILQSQLDCVWHQLSTRTKEHIQDLKILRAMAVKLISDDAVSFYALARTYRSPEYARLTSGWILLDSAEQLFRLAKGRVYNQREEFDPEPCPKWRCLSSLLGAEIPAAWRAGGEDARECRVLVLVRDAAAARQLHTLLTLGTPRYLLYTALAKDLNVTKIADKFKGVQDDMPKKEAPAKSGEEKGDNDHQAADEEELLPDKSSYVLTLTQAAAAADGADESLFEPISQMEELDMTQLERSQPLICIQALKAGGDAGSLARTLGALQPRHVVLYHCDVAAVRALELHEARRPSHAPATAVHLLLYDRTVEEQAYLTALSREKRAFELLIQTKSVMAVPAYQDGRSGELFYREDDDEPQDTRKAGGQSGSKQRPMVVVDMREFRSELPSLLHARGVLVEPHTITIGDYILTPDICVERKSISDLIGSLQSGRLYTQCTHMSRHYARPVLLIEFDQNKPFHLQGHVSVSSEAGGADVLQKLQLLTIHFPRLKLVWSPSPYATADLFTELKQGRSNPVVSAVLAASGADDELLYTRYNAAVQDFLRRLPAVSERNVTRLLNRGRSLDHLLSLSKEQLALLMENERDADTLHAVLHVRARPHDAAPRERARRGRGRGQPARRQPQ